MPISEHLAGLSVKGYRELLKKLRQSKTEESAAAFEDARQSVRLYILSKKLARKPLDPKGAWNRLYNRLLSAKKVGLGPFQLLMVALSAGHGLWLRVRTVSL